MTKEKSILLLIIVVVAGAALAGFLYWKNTQKETPALNNIEIPSPPPDYVDQQTELPLIGPNPPDISDVPKESNAQ